jgi:hypothetical protein
VPVPSLGHLLLSSYRQCTSQSRILSRLSSPYKLLFGVLAHNPKVPRLKLGFGLSLSPLSSMHELPRGVAFSETELPVLAVLRN